MSCLWRSGKVSYVLTTVYINNFFKKQIHPCQRRQTFQSDLRKNLSFSNLYGENSRGTITVSVSLLTTVGKEAKFGSLVDSRLFNSVSAPLITQQGTALASPLHPVLWEILPEFWLFLAFFPPSNELTGIGLSIFIQPNRESHWKTLLWQEGKNHGVV